ncbi:MAG TPA: phage portal protein [Arsenophonus nasoniae]|uniref:phage portal protein n=1 Tax=Arsenophonus nasoniae TaxID=638 RepID=UPI0038790275
MLNWIKKYFTGSQSATNFWRIGSQAQGIHDPQKFFAVFACVSLIASDIGKMPLKIKRLSPSGVLVDTKEHERYSKLLFRPNTLQTRNQFFEAWLSSLLLHGNTYVLIEKNNNNIQSLKILDPKLVVPKITPDGELLYDLNIDHVAGIKTPITVDHTVIIHDRINSLFNPLLGVSPLYSGSLAAKQGLCMQEDSKTFFENGSNPSAILQLKGELNKQQLQDAKEMWEQQTTKQNIGKTVVIPHNIEHKAISINAADAEMIEQLVMTAKVVCSVFHVPPYKIGLESPPSQSAELDNQYYAQCLQPRLEAIEALLAQAFGFDQNYCINFDLNALLRMDAKARYETLSAGVRGGWLKINEARAKENLPPVDGGDSPYLQQQNYSLSALAKRDAQENPFERLYSSKNTQPEVVEVKNQSKIANHS